jgi:hypothetical protein
MVGVVGLGGGRFSSDAEIILRHVSEAEITSCFCFNHTVFTLLDHELSIAATNDMCSRGASRGVRISAPVNPVNKAQLWLKQCQRSIVVPMGELGCAHLQYTSTTGS